MKKKNRTRKTEFVARVPRLLDLALHVEIQTVVKHDWRDAAGARWAMVAFNDTPYLACEKDI